LQHHGASHPSQQHPNPLTCYVVQCDHFDEAKIYHRTCVGVLQV
jgi:hypothetical protein